MTNRRLEYIIILLLQQNLSRQTKSASEIPSWNAGIQRFTVGLRWGRIYPILIIYLNHK